MNEKAPSRVTEVVYHAKKKNKVFAREMYTAGFLYTYSQIVLEKKPLYSNAARTAFCGKMHFVCHIGQVKQTFISQKL